MKFIIIYGSSNLLQDWKKFEEIIKSNDLFELKVMHSYEIYEF